MTDCIVLVTDHPLQTRKLQLELETYGLSVKMVESCHVQDISFPYQSVQAIVLAIDVLEQKGYTLCATLKNNPRTAHIPIILLSHSDTASAVWAAFRAGAEDYIIQDSFASYNVVESLRSLKMIL